MKKIYNLLAILALPSVLLLYSYNSGSPGGKSGSMGDGGNTCTDCHTGGTQSQIGWIITNIPAEGYTPGEDYSIAAEGTHAGVVKFGFELTAEDEMGNKVGTFTLSEPSRTKFTNGETAVTHTANGTAPSGNSNTWSMTWTAPTDAVPVINFNAAFNAANGNGATSGDQIYTSVNTTHLYTPDPHITGVDPDHVQQGFEGELEIHGTDTEWTNGVDEVRFVNHDNSSAFFTADQITIDNDDKLTVDVSVPLDIDIGFYDVYVDNLMLENGFEVDLLDNINENYLSGVVSVYPNPAREYVTIEAPIHSEITIVDLSGRNIGVYENDGQNTNIDVSTYTGGIYFVQVEHNGARYTTRLLKK